MGGDVVCEEFYFGYLPKLQQRLYKVIYQELRKCNQKILVCAPVETVKRVYMAVLDDHPELFFVDTSKVAFSYTAYFCTIMVQYSYSREQIPKMNDEIWKKIEAISQKARQENDIDVMVIKYIHDYIINTVQYDREALNRGITITENQNIVGVFLNYKAVCEGIAKSVEILLNKCKIPCSLVKGRLNVNSRYMDHAWNIVKLDGKWYHLDVTMDSGMSQKNPLFLAYDYFNLDEEHIKKDHSAYQLPVKCECQIYNYFHIAKATMKDTAYLERYLKVGLQRNYKRLYFRIDSNLLRDETIEKIIQDKLAETAIYNIRNWQIRKNQYQRIYEIRLG